MIVIIFKKTHTHTHKKLEHNSYNQSGMLPDIITICIILFSVSVFLTNINNDIIYKRTYI